MANEEVSQHQASSYGWNGNITVAVVDKCLSDNTKVSNTTWGELKAKAMEPDFFNDTDNIRTWTSQDIIITEKLIFA